MDVTGDGSKVRCCKEQYCIGTWNVRSKKSRQIGSGQDGKSKHQHFRNQQTKMDWNGCIYDPPIYYFGQESLRRNAVAIIDNKSVGNAVLGGSFKNDRMISVHFQSKPFSITVIQVYAPTSNTEEDQVEWFYEDLQNLLELTPPKDVLFIRRDWNAKVGSQETPGVTGKFDLGAQNEAGQRLTQFCQENALVTADTLYQQYKRRLYTWTSPDGQHQNHTEYILCSQRWRSSIQPAKTRSGAVAQTMSSLLPNSELN